MSDQTDPDCAQTGHLWPWRPGVGGRKPTPGTDVCRRCGTIRIVAEDGGKRFIRPKPDAPAK